MVSCLYRVQRLQSALLVEMIGMNECVDEVQTELGTKTRLRRSVESQEPSPDLLS